MGGCGDSRRREERIKSGGSVGSNYWVSPLIWEASCPHQIPPPYPFSSLPHRISRPHLCSSLSHFAIISFEMDFYLLL